MADCSSSAVKYYLFVRVRKQKGDACTLHLSSYMCLIQTCMKCLLKPLAFYSSSRVCSGNEQFLVDNQYVCLASLHYPLVFRVNSNSAVLEHKNVRYG